MSFSLLSYRGAELTPARQESRPEELGSEAGSRKFSAENYLWLELGSHNFLLGNSTDVHRTSGYLVGRGAENRTRVPCSQSTYTAAVLRPDSPNIPKASILPLYYAP